MEKFFDRVNHNMLMARVTRKVKDDGVLALIYRFLHGRVMDGEVVFPGTEGTPQGGPLSPLLRNFFCTTWTRNWNSGATRSAGTPTTAK